jgi:hypothetical protein
VISTLGEIHVKKKCEAGREISVLPPFPSDKCTELYIFDSYYNFMGEVESEFRIRGKWSVVLQAPVIEVSQKKTKRWRRMLLRVTSCRRHRD